MDNINDCDREKYLELLDSLTDGIWEWDIKTNKRTFYPSWKRNLGYGTYEIESSFETWISLIHKDDIQYVLEYTEKYLKKDITKYELEYRVRTKSGDYKWILDRARAVWDNEENPIFVMGTHTNITKQKTLESDIENINVLHTELFNNINLPMLIIDPDTLLIIDANNAAGVFFKFSKEVLKSKKVKDLNFVDSKEIFENIGLNKKSRFECQFLSGDFHEYKVKTLEILSNSYSFREKKYILVILRDITLCKNAAKIIEESEERYKKLVELSPDAILVHSDEKLFFANEAGYNLLGLDSFEDLSGKSVLNFVPSEEVEEVKECIRNVIINDELKPSTDLRIKRNDGVLVDVEIAMNTIKYNDNLVILSIIRDVTERKKVQQNLENTMKVNKELLEKTLEYDKLKTEFIANISHELKTPLNIIFSAIQLFNGHFNDCGCKKTRKVTSYIKIAKQNAYRLLRLINNLIDISEVDGKTIKLNLRTCNAVWVVEHVVMSVAEYLRDKGIDLIFDTDIEEKIICFDVRKLEKILLNLLSNAVKYTECNGIIFVNFYQKEDNAFISIKDNGIGIPQRKIGIIFDRFTQVDSLMTRTREGSGIGLYLTKALVEAHNGSITVKSQHGKGTEFVVQLPVKATESHEYNDMESCFRLLEGLENRIMIEFADIF